MDESLGHAALGTGVLRGRRQDLGNELDHGLHQTPVNTQTCCQVVELRQYTLYPGRRDALIDLCDREFVESQEATGIVVIGQFRDMDNPDRFIWLRGFADMPARA